MSSRADFPIALRKSGRKGPIEFRRNWDRKLNSFRLGSQANTCSLSPVLKRVERYRE
jgi:hypothetical protein